jgi:hypothetical protein
MNDRIHNLTRQWTSIGAAFGAPPAEGVIDLERLLLDTARLSPAMARLFIMAATWLHSYGDLIAKHRLKRLIISELDPQHRPVLGLLLDTAQQGSHPLEFESVIKILTPANQPRPLFESESTTPGLIQRAERRSSALSQKWNLWCEPIAFKDDAIRPASWIMARHPDFITRADFRGDLRASILAALQHDPGAGESELRLAQSAGGSRAQVRSALRNLVMTGRVKTRRADGANGTEVSLVHAA